MNLRKHGGKGKNEGCSERSGVAKLTQGRNKSGKYGRLNAPGITSCGGASLKCVAAQKDVGGKNKDQVQIPRIKQGVNQGRLLRRGGGGGLKPLNSRLFTGLKGIASGGGPDRVKS